MSRHYFTHSFTIDSGGDTSNLPGAEELSIVIDGVFLSAYSQSSVSGPAFFSVAGLRGVSGATAESSPMFQYTPSTAVAVNTYFPVRGSAPEGGAVSFAMTATAPDTASALATVWGYYTDSD